MNDSSVNNSMFHYVACGLPDVWLMNGYSVSTTPTGEKVFHIQQIKDLHKCIAQSLIEKPSLLTPEEFRFLRTEMNFSRNKLAAILDISPETVKKWEFGDNPISKMADICLRQVYADNINEPLFKNIIEIINHHEKQAAKICLANKRKGWVEAEAC